MGWKRGLRTVHDAAIRTAFRPGRINDLAFVPTEDFYTREGLWWNQTHLTRPAYEELGALVAKAVGCTGRVLWVGDSWGLYTSTAYAESTGAEVVNRSKQGRRLIDMLPALATAPRADMVVLQFGVNDIYRGGPDPVPDVYRAARLARDPLVVIGVPILVGREDEARAMNLRLAALAT